MASGLSEPMDAFEAWLLRRVAQVVEAGNVPATLLAELWAEIEAPRERPQAQSHANAVRDISVELQMPVEKVEAGLATLETKPRVIREVLLQRIA